MTKSNILAFLSGGLVALAATAVVNAQAPHHVYELRTYTAPPGKLDALVARFRDHTDAIFKRHDMKAIGYWVPEDNKDNHFIYILEHNSKADADRNWAAFQADEEWKKVRAESEKDGPLTTKAPDRVYMDPVDFSKMK